MHKLVLFGLGSSLYFIELPVDNGLGGLLPIAFQNIASKNAIGHIRLNEHRFNLELLW